MTLPRHPLLVTLALMGLLTACDSPAQKETRYIRQGNALFDKGDLDKARIEYKNAARLAPTDAEPRYRLGLVDEAAGDLHNAFANFAAAEQQNPHYHPAALKVAQYHMVAEHFDESGKRLAAILAEDPKDAEAHALNAALLLRQKKLDEAEQEAKAALALDPANLSAASALTGIYAAQNAPDKAEAAINDGIAHNPTNMALLMLRVLLFEQGSDLAKIDQAYQAIFALRPQESRFRGDLASIYVKANRLDEAEAVLRAGVAALPDDWDMKRRLVVFLSEHRDPAIAEAEIQKLMQAYPQNNDLTLWLADLYVAHDQTDKAIGLLEKQVAQEHYDASELNARTMLAHISIARGDKAMAEKLIAAVLAKSPDNRAALMMRATMAFDSGAYQSAISDLRLITRDAPKDKQALQLLGEVLLRQGHLDLAIDTISKLIDADPMNFAARVRLAQLMHMNGDTKQALAIIDQVTATAPDYPVAWENKARILIDDKNWLLADAALRVLDGMAGQHLTAAYLQGQILAQNGKNDEAIGKYAEIINADPTAPLAERAMTALVELYSKQKHLDAAAAFLENLKSPSPFVAALLGKCYAMLGKDEEAAAALDKAIAAKDGLQEPYLDRARLFIKNGKTDQAIDSLAKGAAAAPGDFRAPIMQAGLLEQTGRYAEAVALYEDVLTRNPGLDVAANNMAETIADHLADNPAALEKARQAAERFAGSPNPLLLDTLAWVYCQQGNVPQALTLMDRAVAHNAEAGGQMPPQMHYHYGVILIKAGKKDEGQVELQKAIATTAPYPGLDQARKMMSAQ